MSSKLETLQELGKQVFDKWNALPSEQKEISLLKDQVGGLEMVIGARDRELATLRAENTELRERLAASEAKCDQIDNAYKIQINEDERSFDQWWKANEKGLVNASVEEVAYNAWLDAQDRERTRAEAELRQLRITLNVMVNRPYISIFEALCAVQEEVDAARERLMGGGA